LLLFDEKRFSFEFSLFAFKDIAATTIMESNKTRIIHQHNSNIHNEDENTNKDDEEELSSSDV
jgi:hypothetical protein